MFPNLYHKLNKIITEYDLTSLTIDIFDTILLYDYWPADLRLYDVVVRWLPTFQRLISPEINAYELYDWRMSTKRILEEQGLSLRIDVWFNIIIDAICNKYDIALSPEEKFELLTSMIGIETSFEMTSSKPNLELIQQVARLKKEHPELKVYFVVNSHLTSEQIKSLLKIRQITIFDSGISSADIDKRLDAGELFEQVAAKFGPNFDLTSNLHIGDNRTSDLLAPRHHDSHALHYRPLRMRGMRTMVGETWLYLLEQNAKFHECRKANQTKKAYATWREYGTTLASIHQAWAWQTRALTQIHLDHSVYLIGDEASNVVKYDSFTNCENLEIIPSINHDNLIRAFVWLLATYHTARWDAAQILNILIHTEKLSRKKLYQICFAKSYNYSEMAINTFTEDEFASTFFNELTSCDPEHSAPARTAYELIATKLPQSTRPLLLIQVHTDSTPELFQEFTKLHGITNTIEAFYLDQNDVVKKSTRALRKLINPRRQKQIDLGAIDADFKQTKIAPDKYIDQILLPRLEQLTKQLRARSK